jgi:hypothetical protein
MVVKCKVKFISDVEEMKKFKILNDDAVLSVVGLRQKYLNNKDGLEMRWS